MKKLLLAAAALLALSGAANAQTVRMGTEAAYAPWNFLDDSGKPAGYDVDVGNELCKRANLECTWVANEWDTIISNLVAGNYDAIVAAMSITDERKQTIDFSDAYYPPDPSRYVTNAGANFDFAALKGVKLGVQGGTIQAAYAEANLKDGNTIQSYATYDQAMADLAAGNLDVVLADGPYLDPIVSASNGAVVFAGPEVSIGEGYGIGLRKGDADLKDKLNAALEAAKADGTIDTLIAKWFPGKGPFYKK
ncbi:transporter substrate-binding domain-containing protein [Paradevosia shaoguanensis]|uniref:transporter substrate-binding domain-containing protein n=1 Tax=Paradevosia shaoguanensis TaxID=1335043 RepID=UPI000455CC12|nr:transporter substrate-binding domain-containing protein [Paradevosia shaoguanensis]MBI4045886.1 transporter substrate-binding domain-containing protein [Devosia nanyangense]QMV01008.1 transporter substrate-binding domain-containing protein [Devosia sp. D6-9]CDP50339.1 His/Glu/Gln/Arg/opine family ABC transporter, peri plasmic His/Glu/Gln/Arg/opine family-binding protein [Devosia sp. DBB001]